MMKSAFLAEKIHKWLSLIIGIQAVLWLVSGVYMVVVHIDYIHGDHLVRPIERNLPPANDIVITLEDLKQSYDKIETFTLKTLAGTPYYEVLTDKAFFLINATTGTRLDQVPEDIILHQANAIYAAEGKISTIEYLTQGPQEMQNRKVALWRVDFEDKINTSFYFSPKNGELISRRHDYWRAFDFLWMLHIMDYDTRDDITTTLFRTVTIISLVSFLAGLWYTWFRFTKTSRQEDATLVGEAKQGAMPLMRTVHKWIGLFVGLQIIIWTLSALIMSYMGPKNGRHYSAGLPNSELTQETSLITPQALLAGLEGAKPDRLKLIYLLDQYIYEASSKSGTQLYKADTGAPLTISSQLAKRIAEADYVGETMAEEPVYFKTAPYAAKGHVGPVWQVPFTDPENPTFYVAADTGKVLQRRDDQWETFDFWWMLHMMDFAKKGSFNNAIIITFALVSLLIGLTGFILLFDCFNRDSFNFKAKWANFRAKPIAVQISHPEGTTPEVTLFMKPGTILFEGLADAGYDLPSNCGGQGDCGLCRVEFIEGASEPTENEKKRVPKRRLEKGRRLACQNTINKAVKIVIHS